MDRQHARGPGAACRRHGAAVRALHGAVALHAPGQSEFAETEIAFVGALANQAALAIDKASLYALERRTSERLRELDRARSDFVAVVTHDLRTPLSVVRGYLDLFAEQTRKGKNGHGLPLAEATAQVERLDQLVDRILASVKDDRPDVSVVFPRAALAEQRACRLPNPKRRDR